MADKAKGPEVPDSTRPRKKSRRSDGSGDSGASGGRSVSSRTRERPRKHASEAGASKSSAVGGGKASGAARSGGDEVHTGSPRSSGGRAKARRSTATVSRDVADTSADERESAGGGGSERGDESGSVVLESAHGSTGGGRVEDHDAEEGGSRRGVQHAVPGGRGHAMRSGELDEEPAAAAAGSDGANGRSHGRTAGGRVCTAAVRGDSDSDATPGALPPPALMAALAGTASFAIAAQGSYRAAVVRHRSKRGTKEGYQQARHQVEEACKAFRAIHAKCTKNDDTEYAAFRAWFDQNAEHIKVPDNEKDAEAVCVTACDLCGITTRKRKAVTC